jgi:hypothetical protein
LIRLGAEVYKEKPGQEKGEDCPVPLVDDDTCTSGTPRPYLRG